MKFKNEHTCREEGEEKHCEQTQTTWEAWSSGLSAYENHPGCFKINAYDLPTDLFVLEISLQISFLLYTI